MLHGQGYKQKLRVVAGVFGTLFLLGCIPLTYQVRKHLKNKKHRKQVEQQMAKQLKDCTNVLDAGFACLPQPNRKITHHRYQQIILVPCESAVLALFDS